MEKLSKSFRRALFISLLIVGLSTFSSMSICSTTVSYEPPSYSSLTPHDPISITSDSDFEIFPGSGTAEDPYLIEGYNITTTSRSGISITYTTKHFVIRDCYVDAEDDGIYIDNAADGTVAVINNMCSNNNWGIMIWYSESATVANNTCNNNSWEGIKLWYSESATVANNTCSNNNMDGIYLWYSGSSTVVNNTCTKNNNYGIRLYNSGSAIVANNTFTNCGLYIDENTIDAYLSYTVENNWVNGKKLGFYTKLESTAVAEPVYGQLILVDCTDVTVRNQILNNGKTSLSLYYCTYSVIINNTCNNGCGIYLHHSDHSTVANNTCSNNINYGIMLYYSWSSTVINNTCNNNYLEGIYLDFSGSSMVTTIVANNTCNNNNKGIYLFASSSSTVINNTCSNNNYGISLSNSGSATVANNTCNNNDIGIALYLSGSATVANNTCNNNGIGIWFDHSNFCVVNYNLLQENEGYGVKLRYSSDNCTIHHNTFVDNNLGGTSQAFDACTNNTWYDPLTLEGNYWSDWSGTGNYSIDGSVESVDLYPLDEPPVEYSTVVDTTDETQISFTFTLLITIVPLLLIKLFSRKRLKIA